MVSRMSRRTCLGRLASALAYLSFCDLIPAAANLFYLILSFITTRAGFNGYFFTYTTEEEKNYFIYTGRSGSELYFGFAQ
jgi:hypothetical protein